MADRDFLEEIKMTEQEAVSRVEKARENAQLQRQMARQEAGGLLEKAYIEANAIRQKKMQEAEIRYRELTAGDSQYDANASWLPEPLLADAAKIIAERIVALLEHR